MSAIWNPDFYWGQFFGLPNKISILLGSKFPSFLDHFWGLILGPFQGQATLWYVQVTHKFVQANFSDLG